MDTPDGTAPRPSAPPAGTPSLPPPGSCCGVHPERSATLLCARCGTFACEACARPGGVCATCHERVGVVPWERRTDPDMGIGRALWLTARDSLLRPTQLFAMRYRERSPMGALAYGAAIYFVAALFSFLYQVLAIDLGSVAQRFTPQAGARGSFLESTVFEAVMLLLSPFVYVLGAYIKAGVWHLMLRITGGGTKGFDRTLRTLAYTEATSVLVAVPLLGPVLIMFVGPVYACIALTAAHETDWWRVVVALILIVTILCSFCFAGVLLAMMALTSLGPGAFGQ